jgi:hypothetical protein
MIEASPPHRTSLMFPNASNKMHLAHILSAFVLGIKKPLLVGVVTSRKLIASRFAHALRSVLFANT